MHRDELFSKIRSNIEHDLLRYPDYDYRMLSKSRFLMVLPPGHPLTREKGIQQEDLKYETLIIHDFHRALNTNGHMQVLNVYYAKEYTPPLIPLFLEEV